MRIIYQNDRKISKETTNLCYFLTTASIVLEKVAECLKESYCKHVLFCLSNNTVGVLFGGGIYISVEIKFNANAVITSNRSIIP